MTSTSEYPSALPPSADNESSNSDPSSVSEEDGKTSKAGGKLADALRRAVNVRRFIHERRENQEHAETQGDEAGPTRADLMARLDLAESIIASQEEEIRCFPNIPSLLVEPTVTRAVCRQQYLEIDSLVKSCTDSARKFVMFPQFWRSPHNTSQLTEAIHLSGPSSNMVLTGCPSSGTAKRQRRKPKACRSRRRSIKSRLSNPGSCCYSLAAAQNKSREACCP